MIAESDYCRDLYEFVSEFSRRLSLVAPRAAVILVGGSAFALHFPQAHASADADLFVRLHENDNHQTLLGVLTGMGFKQDGRCFGHPNAWFTVEFVAGELCVGESSVVHMVETHRTKNGNTFSVLSPTAMVFDRLVAWAHRHDATSLLGARVAALTAVEKIEFGELKLLLRNEMVFNRVLDALADDDPLKKHLTATE